MKSPSVPATQSVLKWDSNISQVRYKVFINELTGPGSVELITLEF
jgi:hypothetical protein